jgi:glycosyltransferase involved in cell wall biosynthesis
MDSKKKILFLDHTPFAGGAQLAILEHIEKINKNDFDVFVACSEKAGELGFFERYEKAGVKFFVIPFGKLKKFNFFVFFKFFQTFLAVRKILKQKKIDIIFTNTVRADIVGLFSSVFTKTRVIWYLMDDTFPKFLFWALKYFPDIIFFISNAIAESHNIIPGERKYKLLYLWSDFDDKMKNFSAEDVAEQKKRWNIRGEYVVGYVGRLVVDKGVQFLLEAIEILVKKGINIKCVVVGSGKNQEGDNENILKSFVMGKGLEEKIIFTGFSDKIPLCMLCFDAICLPSIVVEGFGLVLAEAMLLKIPVIATNIGGPSEIIKHKETGLLVPPKNAQALAASIEYLIDNREEAKKYTEAAFQYSRENFLLDSTNKKLENIYKNL